MQRGLKGIRVRKFPLFVVVEEKKKKGKEEEEDKMLHSYTGLDSFYDGQYRPSQKEFTKTN